MNKIKRIVLINILIIFLCLFINNVSFARDLSGISDLRSSHNVGNEIYVKTGEEDDTGGAESLEMSDERDHIYCIQHKAGADHGWMTVDEYMEIRGNQATAYWNYGYSNRTVYSKYNIALGYLLGQEGWRKGYSMGNAGKTRQQAIHHLLTNDWGTYVNGNSGLYGNNGLATGGSQTLLWNKWFDYWYTTRSDSKGFLARANAEANNENAHCVPNAKINSTTVASSASEAQVTGPYYLTYSGRISWVCPIDQYGNWIEGSVYRNEKWTYDYNIKFYKDANCTNEYKMTEIPSGAAFYIKNTSGKEIKQIQLRNTYGVNSWLQTDMKTVESSSDVIGPICLNYSGVIDWISPINEYGNWIEGNVYRNGKWTYDKNISFYTDAACTKKIEMTSIPSNTNFYIKNTSGEKIKNINIKLKNNSVYCANIWFLERSDGRPGQRLISATTRTEYCGSTIILNVKQKTRNLTINKKDSITNNNITSPAEFKIKTSKGKWLTGTSGSYNYENSDVSLATKYRTNANGVLELKDLLVDTYEIFEVASPNGYDIQKQNGYDKTNNWINCGKVDLNVTNSNVTISIKNDLIISISGYVWKDLVPESKLTDTNNLWDTNEERISGVTVRLMKKGNPPTEVAITTTGNDGSYVFKDLISRYSLKDHYIEFNYNGTNYKKYIPVAFGATSTNGSKAIVQNMPEYDRDFEGIATTYTGTNDATKESQYGLDKCGTFNANARTLENINLGIKEVPKPEYDIRENIATVKITMKGFTYTYVYGGERGESRIYAPQVTYQNKNDITAYRHSFYPTDIAYDKTKNTEELKAEVKYRIDVKNTENMNLESTYKEETMYLKQLVNDFDVNRYTLADDNWTAGQVTTDSNGNKKQTATIKENYLNTIYDQTLGIKPENKITAYINFSVNHDAILDILNHPDGIAEGFPTEATATAYHKYTRNDYSWDNNILKGQTHYTEDDERKAQAPYLIFTLGKDRTINGKVFEDKVVTDNGEKLGNGTNEQGESAVKGVKVELLDATKDEIADVTKLSVSNLYTVDVQDSAPLKEVSKTAIVDTDENGNYTLKGVVPGYYILRYTYGDGTQEYTDSNGNKISVDVESKIRNTDGQEKTVYAKDYKSTIVTSQVAKNALENSNENTYTWYRKLEGENYSVAIDSLNERKALNNDKENNIIDDSKENTKENEKVIIDAGTAKMYLGIENNKDDKETEDVEVEDNVQKEEYKNEINGINFGIIEQPIQQAKVEKVITYVTLTNSQNNVVFDGNPENAKMQGVSDLDNQQNGGSIYVRAEVLEDIIYSSKLELDYEIRVTNVSDVNYYEDNYYLYGDKNGAHEITLKVNEVTDYLDETLKYLPEKSDKDRVSTEIKSMKLDDRNVQVLKLNKWDDVLFTNKLNDNSRKTTDKVTIVAERTLSREDKDMEIINEAEITGIKHATETGNTEEEKLKIAPSEVHTNGRVKVVTSITPPTGENKQLGVYYAIAGIVTLVLLSAGIVIIKKKIK